MREKYGSRKNGCQTGKKKLSEFPGRTPAAHPVKPAGRAQISLSLGSLSGFFWSWEPAFGSPGPPGRAQSGMGGGTRGSCARLAVVNVFSAVSCFGSENGRALNFLANRIALIAEVGSENQAQPTRVLTYVLRFNGVW